MICGIKLGAVRSVGFWLVFLVAGPAVRGQDSDATKNDPAVVATVAESELKEFSANPEPVRKLLSAALALTTQNLTYTYGSADPAQGGMDCSGTIYYLLREQGLDGVPRTASDQYVWARKAGDFEAVVSRSTDSFELDDLRPGDLLFWTGTYSSDRDPPVTHTMIYLGRAVSDDTMLMVGASDGRSYRGKKMNGVSVFDFTIPKANPQSANPGARFAGYARIPGIDEKSE